MVAIEATEEEVAEAIAGKEAELAIAAVNGPASIVVSGDEEAVEEVQRPVRGARAARPSASPSPTPSTRR